MPSGFKNILFGFSAAEKEFTDNPRLLDEGFFDICECLHNIIYGNKFLILGPKGSGKSAIAAKLELCSVNDENLSITSYDLDDFPFSGFSKLLPTDEDPKIRYSVQWQFLLLISFLDSFHKDPLCKFHGKYKDLIKGLQDLGVFPGKSLTDMVKIAIRKEFKITLISPLQGSRTSEQQKINQSIEVINATLKDVCFSVETDVKHLLIIDNLDRVLVKREREKQLESLAALINAVDRINNKFKINNIQAKIIVLCRTDLYENLKDSNKNKIKQDSSIELNWYQRVKPGEDINLTKLINLRAKSSLGKNVDVIAEFFPKKIWNDDTLITLLRNTRYRPRDLIILLNYIQANTSGECPTVNEVRYGISEYSQKYFVGEILDELYGFMDIEEAKLVLNLLGEMDSIMFNITDLKERQMKRECYSTIDLDRSLTLLYDCSAIGIVKKRASGEEKYSFKYRNPNDRACVFG